MRARRTTPLAKWDSAALQVQQDVYHGVHGSRGAAHRTIGRLRIRLRNALRLVERYKPTDYKKIAKKRLADMASGAYDREHQELCRPARSIVGGPRRRLKRRKFKH